LGRFLRFRDNLSNRRNRLASRPREGLNLPSTRNDSATIAPCFTAFLLPFRARRQPSAFDIPQLPAQPALGTATRSASISRGPENNATRNKAMALRDALTSHMTPDQIAEAKRNASEWVSK
jgi:hypothetical protein